MGSVDNRVVSVKFDNSEFQNKVGPTLQNLDKLKAGLDLDKQTSSLEGLTNAGKRFNLNSIAETLDNINAKFGALGTVAFSVINNIVDRFTNASLQIANSFTLGPINSGFQEFETNANSIQTILANTADAGTNLDQVTGALDNLNEYADKTIYSFSQMAKNIGTFTAAGISLEDSTNAIKGISNLSAMAGSSAEQAANVMYQLSQAMSAGKVSAVDWISVTNAGIGGPLQKQLFEAAKALHTLNNVPVTQTFSEWQKAGGNFKDAMAEGVFTADVLKLALSAMSGEMSKQQLIAKGYTEQQADYVLKTAGIGERAATEVKTFTQLVSTLKEAVGTGWAETFKKIIGNFEEAKDMFTGLSNVFGGIINRMSETRNGLLEGWRFFGGQKALIQSFRDVLWSLLSVVHSVTSAFREVFPAMQPERLANLTKSFERFTQMLIPSAENLNRIHRIFVGFFSILHAGWTIIKTVGLAIKDFFSSLNFIKSIPGGILEVFAKIGDGAKTLMGVIGDGSAIKNFLDKYLGPLAEKLNAVAEKIKPIINDIGAELEKLKTFLSNIFGKDSTSGYESFSDKIGEATGRIRQRWEQLTQAGGKFQEFWSKLQDFFNRAKEEIGKVWDKITEAFQGGNFDSVLDKVNTGLLGGFLLILRRFVKDGLKINVKGFSDVLEGFAKSFDAFSQKMKSDVIKNIAVSIAILTASLLVLSLIDSAALSKALTVMAAFFAQIVITLKALDELISGARATTKIVSITAGLAVMSLGIIGFVVAIKMLAGLDTDKMLMGIAGLSLVLAMMILFIKSLTKMMDDINKKKLDSSNLVDLGIGLIGVGIAIRLMAGAVKVLAEMPIEQMFQGLLGLGAIMAAIALLAKATDGDHYIAMALGMFIIAFAIKFMVSAVEKMAEMDYNKLVQGIEAFVVIMATLALTISAMPDDTAKIGLGLFAISRALDKMVEVIKNFGEMDFGTLAKGIGAVATVLLVFAGALWIMKGSLEGGLALLVLVGALVILYEVIKNIGELGLGTVIVALLAIVGTIGVLTIAAIALGETGAIIVLEALALVLLEVGASVLLAGLGVYLIAQAFNLLIDAAKKLQETGIGAVRAFLEFLPEIAAAGAKTIGAFLGSLFEQIPKILEKLGPAVASVVQFIVENAPKFGEAFTAIFQTILTILEQNVPRLIEVGFKLLIAFLSGVRDNISNITSMVNDIIIAFLQSIGDKIELIVQSGTYLLTRFIQGIADNIWMIFESAGNLITKFIQGMDSVIQKVIDAGGDVIAHIIEGIGKKAEDIAAAGTDTLIRFLDSIKNDTIRFANAGLEIVTNLLNGLADAIDKNAPELRAAGLNLARALIDGITGGLATKAGEVWEAFKNTAKSALGGFAKFLGIESPSKVMYQMGIYTVQGFTNAVNQDSTVEKAFGNLGNSAMGALSKSLSSGNTISDLISESNPTITPVLDMTNVDRGLASMSKKKPVIDTFMSFGQASSLAKATKLLSAADAPIVPTSKNVSNEYIFNQTIHSPKELNMSEMYRQTKSQFVSAKEGLEGLSNEGN